MKHVKLHRFISLLLTLCVAASLLPSFVLHSEAAPREGSYGDQEDDSTLIFNDYIDYYRLLLINDMFSDASYLTDLSPSYVIGKEDLSKEIKYMDAGLFNISEWSEDDWFRMELKAVSVLCTAEGSILSGVPVIGSLFSGAGSAVRLYTIESDMKKMAQQLSDQLDSVYHSLNDNIGVVSDQVQHVATSISNQISQSADLQASKEKMDQFLAHWGTVNNVNQGYYAWKKELYKKYNNYVDTVKNEEDVKEAVDQLYMSAIKSLQLLDYMIPEGGNSQVYGTIQDIYFNFLLLENANNSGSLNAKGIRQSAIDFVYDLYSTFLLAQTYLTICYDYQWNNLSGSYYRLNNQGFDPIHKNDIKDYINEGLQGNIQKLRTELARFYVRVLGLDETYQIKRDGFTRTVIYNQLLDPGFTENTIIVNNQLIESKSWIAYNKVQAGDVIYLANIPDELLNTVGSDFSFVLDEQKSTSNIATVSKSGVVTISSNAEEGDIVVNMVKGNKKIYSISFSIGENRSFAFGSGTKMSPFVITNVEAFNTFCSNGNFWAEGCFVELGADLDFGNEKIPSIGTYRGSFNGNGYTLMNIKNAPLFGDNYGDIRNLNLANISASMSHHYTIDAGIWYAASRISTAGILCDSNYGSITNCAVKESSIYIQYDSTFKIDFGVNYYTVQVGAICGSNLNSGSISYCSSQGNTVYGYNEVKPETAKAHPTSNSDIITYVGGIVGSIEGGRIDNCLSKNNRVISCAFGYTRCDKEMSGWHEDHWGNSYAGSGEIYGNCNSNAGIEVKNVVCVDNQTSISSGYTYSTNNYFFGNCKKATLEGNRTDAQYYGGRGAPAVQSRVVKDNITDDDIAALKASGWYFDEGEIYVPSSERSFKIALAKGPNKAQYEAGDTFNPYGISLLKTDANGNQSLVVNDITVDDLLTINYMGQKITKALDDEFVDCCHDGHISQTTYSGKSASTVTLICDDCGQAIVTYKTDTGVSGDADGDGEVTDWDSMLLDRYLAGWKVEIDLDVLDVDNDGEVSDWDGMLISRYLAGWKVIL
ncbi:MAG: hypothetical protein K6G89_06620 [Clostridia bacterium]|nr:hypothetical protein [Clostridia bacterium]